MNKFTNSEILIELLKMRQVPEEHAKVAADLVGEMMGGTWPQERTTLPTESPPVKEESLNDFIREMLERALLLPVQMFLDRLPDEQRERLKKRIVL